MTKTKKKNPKRISKKQKEFVKEFVETGNATKSALKTYDTEDYDTAANIGYGNLKKPQIQQMINDAAVDAQSTIHELTFQRKNLPVALGASKDIMDRAGFKPKDPNINIEGGNFVIKWMD